jgi:isopenicillin N synthase-like dioxygenase
MAMRASQAEIDQKTKVEILDLNNLRHPDISVRRELGREMAFVYQNVSFFYVINHGVPDVVIARMFELGRTFFDLPINEKMAVSMANSEHYRG